MSQNIVRTHFLIFIQVIAFIIRLGCIILDTFWFKLPQSGMDTSRSHNTALFIKNNWPYTFMDTISNGPILFDTIGAMIYTIFGDYPMLWAICLLPLGLLTIWYVYKTVLLITDNKNQALLAASVIAFFPNVVILQSIILRESIIQCLVIVGIYYMLKYLHKGTLTALLFHFLALFLATVFHSGLISLVLCSFLILFIFKGKNSYTIKIFLVIGFCGLLLLMNYTGMGLDKFGGSFRRLFKIVLLGGQRLNEGATSNYPSWLLLSGTWNDLFILPARMVAFFTAPLVPFLVTTKGHLLVLLDTILYITLLSMNLYHIKVIRSKIYYKIIVSYIIVFTAVFAMGASNFSTNARHRAKVIPLIILLPLCSEGFMNRFSSHVTKTLRLV